MHHWPVGGRCASQKLRWLSSRWNWLGLTMGCGGVEGRVWVIEWRLDLGNIQIMTHCFISMWNSVPVAEEDPLESSIILFYSIYWPMGLANGSHWLYCTDGCLHPLSPRQLDATAMSHTRWPPTALTPSQCHLPACPCFGCTWCLYLRPAANELLTC